MLASLLCRKHTPVLFVLSALGLYGIHSFRRGGASEASNNNVDHRLIMSHGRWSSQKSKDLYVEDDIHKKLSVSSALGL